MECRFVHARLRRRPQRLADTYERLWRKAAVAQNSPMTHQAVTTNQRYMPQGLKAPSLAYWRGTADRRH